MVCGLWYCHFMMQKEAYLENWKGFCLNMTSTIQIRIPAFLPTSTASTLTEFIFPSDNIRGLLINYSPHHKITLRHTGYLQMFKKNTQNCTLNSVCSRAYPEEAATSLDPACPRSGKTGHFIGAFLVL